MDSCSNPFDVWYTADLAKPKGDTVADKKRAYEGPQCKAMVESKDDDSAPSRCRLGVWKKYPRDGYCYMHHPKVDMRGGAARSAIARGDLTPKTAQARRRLNLNKKEKRDKSKAKTKPKTKTKPTLVEEEEQGDTPYSVTFTEHRVTEDGEIGKLQGKVSFFNLGLAKGFVDILSQTSPMHPLQNQGELFFYSDVESHETPDEPLR